MTDGTCSKADGLLEDLLTEYVLDCASRIGPLHGTACHEERLNNNIYNEEDMNHGK